MTRRLVQLALQADDLPASTAFYRDALGLNVVFSAPNMALLDGGVRILLGERGNSVSRVIPYFESSAIDTDYAEALRLGGLAHTAPHQVGVHAGKAIWIAHFVDPAGNLISLIEERSAA